MTAKEQEVSQDQGVNLEYLYWTAVHLKEAIAGITWLFR